MLPDSLRLLGAFQLVDEGEPVTLGQPRLEELVALLAIHPGVPFTRVQIAYHFWPDSSERQARTNARNLLYKLKNAWPRVDQAITIDHSQVTWRADAVIAVDVHRFAELQREAEQCAAAEERVPLLTEAADCYQGDLLPSCYSEWVLTEREQLRSRLTAVLEALSDAFLELRRYDEALQWAKQLRNHDSFQESAYRRLMQVYSLLNDRAAALRVYHACVSMLEKEWGVEPSPVTVQLHAQLLQYVPDGKQQDTPQAVERPHLVGRQQEWRQLQQLWRSVQHGHAQCVIIWGEAGIGKTRLAEELVDWAQRLGHTWASSRSYAAQGALSYAPITEWLRSPSVQPALATIDDLWRVELARLLPELLTDRPDLPPPGPLTETWQQQRFFQSIIQALQAVPAPLLLHLDDMQWSDAETLTLLQFLLHGARRYPMLIVGAVRTEDAASNRPLTALVDALRHNNQLVELHLAPLSPEETMALAEQIAGASITAAKAQAFYAASEGHPLFLIETVRGGLAATGSLSAGHTRVTGTSHVDGLAPIPPKIYNLLSARLGQLSPAAHEVANTAAVIGRAFTYQVLHTTLAKDELSLIDALDELWARRIIREQPDDTYDFSHDRIREVAYLEISRTRRRLLHRQVAAALEVLHRADLDNAAGELAAHYAQAGDSDHAYRYYRQAAKVALNQYALAQAEALLDAAFAHAPQDPVVRIQLLLEQNRVFHTAVKFDRWRNNLDQQVALLASAPAADPRLRLNIELDRSLYFGTIGHGVDAVDAALAAIEIAQTINDSTALAQCFNLLGGGYWHQARMTDASRAFGRSAHYAREAGDRTLETRSVELQAQTGMFSGMPAEQILDLLTRAFEAAKALANKQLMAHLSGKLGYWRLELGMGNFERAEQEYRYSLALIREIGDEIREKSDLSNLGVLFTNKGDYGQALNAFDAAMLIGQGYRHFWRNAVTRHNFGVLMMQMGRLDSAHTELTNASQQFIQLGNRHFEVKARAELGFLYHLAGDYQRAQAELTHVLSLIEGHGDLRLEALVRTRLGYVLEANGQLDEARSMYAHGCNLHNQMGQAYYALNPLAGIARLAGREDDHATALTHVQTIWETIAGKEMDATVETARTLRTCYEVFRQADDPRADAVLKMAGAQLRRRAGSIDDPEHLAQFWQLADHCFLRDATAADDLT